LPHNLDLIFTLTGGLTAALVLGFVTQRLRLSPIVGYLLAGIVVGPFTPGFVAHHGLAEQMAELGVILLMFGVGLHFDAKELLAVRRIAIPGALAQIAAATLLGVWITRYLGWSLGAGIVFGLAISVASTVVLLRVLADNDALHTAAGHVAVGWLLVEDLFTVLVLVMLPLLAGRHEGGATEVAMSVGLALLKVGVLVVFTLTAGKRVIPWLLGYVARTRSRELFTLTVLVVTLGIAVGSVKLFGASMALGAFLAGMVVGQSEFSSRAASEALPMRDAFAVLFFVSMGMLFDPKAVLPNLALTLATLGVVLLAKPLSALVVVLLLKSPPGMAATVALALAQIGEFSFILAALGRELGILPAPATQALVVAGIVSITLNPLLFRLVEPLGRFLTARVTKTASTEADLPVAANGQTTIVVGYGPVGRTLAELLREHDLEPTVIELNHDTVNQLRESGVRALYGDAAQREILEQAGIRNASALIFAASGSADPVIRAARDLNPELLVVARSNYLREISPLREAGANAVISAELEVAFGMAERLLTEIGATPEQIDRARDRVRSELLSA
jgi:monovalent cation:H+ antiporter-2, CPA2 family